MSRFDDRVKEVTDRMLVAMQAFWSAMLTAHTVLLSVAVALPTISPLPIQWQIKLVGLLATASIFALLFNFASLRMQYEAIGRRLHNHDLELSKAERKNDISLALWRNLLMRIMELLAAALLIVEACLFMLVLL